MPIYLLDRRLVFPDPSDAPSYGPLAVGGDLRPERLELAYRSGIFPWYSQGQPILWYSPDPRFVLWAEDLLINRSLRKHIRKHPYTLRMDTAFPQVIEACSKIPRPGQDGTWITREMKEAYIKLHQRGLAHSIEAWHEEQLVGGLYGISMGGAFFGESMFATAPDASKIAFVAAVQQLLRWGIPLVDCQVHTEHLERFGAEEWPRDAYLAVLQDALLRPTKPGPWSFDPDFEIQT
ncbi:MAG: leucyl/phenylalanyl-tRNA--protein transferase [Myxococcales bacterium]|nr:leucyl/phenylalanyl-tRNA--protein transferase [Myxococcales bacterium]